MNQGPYSPSPSPFNRHLNRHRFSATLKQALDIARTRLLIVGAVFSFFILVVSYRLVDLTLLSQNPENGYMNAASSSLMTGRADLLDRNGALLATTIRTNSVYANTKLILDPEGAAKKLCVAFPKISYPALLHKLRSGASFVWVMRHTTPQQKAKILKLGIAGLNFVRDHRRIYPQGPLTSHVIGFTDVDNQGISGLEKGLEAPLRASAAPVVLSLDLRFQHIVRDELLKGMEEFNAIGASGLIMDLKTGEILSMVSLPDFDPDQPSGATEDQRFNRCTLGIYEMGSIAKVINTAMVLETGAAQLDTIVDTSRPLRVGRFTITDYRANYGRINTAQVFVHSSNIGSALLALEAGPEKQRGFFRQVGLFDSIRIQLPENSKPNMPRHWRRPTVITASYGYGFSVSPLHILCSIASIVGDGTKITPTLLKEDLRENLGENSAETPERNPEETSPLQRTADSLESGGSPQRPPRPRVVSPSVTQALRQLMRLTVTDGTATQAQVPGYFVAGKTGTAKLLLKGRYDRSRTSNAFMGIFGPSAENPQYAILIRLDDPKGMSHTYGFNNAGWNVAPVTGRIIARIASLLGMPPQDRSYDSIDPFLRTINFKKGGH